MNREVLELVDAQQITESRSLYFWQKFINGVKMTFINCQELHENCELPPTYNRFNFYVHYKDVMYHFFHLSLQTIYEFLYLDSL